MTDEREYIIQIKNENGVKFNVREFGTSPADARSRAVVPQGFKITRTSTSVNARRRETRR